MQFLQTALDYAAIAPFIVAAGMFLEYAWRRSTPKNASVATASQIEEPYQPVEEIQVQLATELHIPDHTAIAEAALADELIQAYQDAAIFDLLEIPATPYPMEVNEASFVPLAKLYSIPGSGRWSNRRKLKETERQAILAAIAV